MIRFLLTAKRKWDWVSVYSEEIHEAVRRFILFKGMESEEDRETAERKMGGIPFISDFGLAWWRPLDKSVE